MSIENKNIVSLDLKKEEKILDFSDFQKKDIIEAYSSKTIERVI